MVLLLTVTNQEVLTKDHIALRFSFNVSYSISDGPQFLGKFALDRPMSSILLDAEQRVYHIVQRYLRNRIAEIDSETLNEKRNELTDFRTGEMDEEVAAFGISIEQARWKPRSGQNPNLKMPGRPSQPQGR